MICVTTPKSICTFCNHNANSLLKSSVMGYFDVYAAHFHGALTCQRGLDPHECSGFTCDKASDCFIMTSLPGFT